MHSGDHDDLFSDDDAGEAATRQDEEARREAGGKCSSRQRQCVIGEWVAQLGSRSAVRSERGKDVGAWLAFAKSMVSVLRPGQVASSMHTTTPTWYSAYVFHGYVLC